MLENEFKRFVYLGTNNHSSRWSLSKFVVSKHPWWEFLHGEPCFRLDISAYMLSKIRDFFTYSAIKWVKVICSNALNSRKKPAVSPMSGSPTFDIDK